MTREYPLCRDCWHLNRRVENAITCDAFPKGIPEEILNGEFDHHKSYPGDNGLRYRPLGESCLLANSKPGNCPECDSDSIAEYLYGYPSYSEEMCRQIDAGELILGGCCISGRDPLWKCNECGARFYDDVFGDDSA